MKGAAHYQFNSAMQLSKVLAAERGQRINPRDVALKVLAAVPDNDFVAGMEVAGPGFVNISIREDVVTAELTKVG